MSRKELESMKVDELAKVCKEKGIPYYKGKTRLKKAEMIDAILGAETSAEQVESAKDEDKVDNQVVEAVTKNENDSASDKVDMTQKMPYIENIEIGTVVAFRLKNGKVKSAKVIKKSTKNRKLKVETNYGATYVVQYEDVVWVRTGKRWPRGVYNLLKGLVDSDGKEKGTES